MEELLRNVMQHATAGRGLRNVQARMQRLNGSAVFGTRSDGPGKSVELRLPTFQKRRACGRGGERFCSGSG